MRSTVLFSTESYNYLRESMRDSATRRGLPWLDGRVEKKYFPDGERYLRLGEDVTGRDVVLVGGTISDSDTLELYDLACALARYGSHTLTVVVPYFGYSTMERAVLPGEVVTAKTRARLLSAIPLAGSGNKIFLVDLHVDAVTHYFEGGIRPFHIYAKDVVTQMIRESGGADYVLACTDAGRAKWVESLANDLGVAASFVFKKRVDDRHTTVSAVSAQVSGKRVVIYDDMIRTGSSLLRAAEAYRDAGARDVFAVATHGAFAPGALQEIKTHGVVCGLRCTNTHPRVLERAAAEPTYLTVHNLADVLVDKVAVAARGSV